MDVDTFTNLPIFWKTIIILGFITMITMCILIIILIFITYSTPKIDMEVNLDDYKDFVEDFCKETPEDSYPKLPIIKDLEGNPLKDSLQIIQI